jgi:glycosyltransferase involved in cell wall biosynthesis
VRRIGIRENRIVDISVVIPVYRCRESLEELHARLVASLEAITDSFEIILVNDACPQNSWEIVAQIALRDDRVKGIDLSRNFGQIRAITAGLSYAIGRWVVVMDCDLQDRPEEIVRLYSKAQEGFDVVFSRRALRRDTFLKKLASKVFYKIYGYFTEGKLDPAICNFSISRHTVIENYLKMQDRNRAFILFIKWMGFKTAEIDVQHAERCSGKSSYTLRKQLRLAGEIITTQSNKPLILSIRIGSGFAILAFLYTLYLVVRYFAQGINVAGWTTTVVSIWFVSGVIMVQLGIVGLYIGYVFDQTKNRPIFIVREIIDGRARSGNTDTNREASDTTGGGTQRAG